MAGRADSFERVLWDKLKNGPTDSTDDLEDLDEEDSGPRKDGIPENLGTIDSVDGRSSLPFSVIALAVSFALLYFTPVLELVFGLGSPSVTIDSGMKLLVSFFLALGIGVLWEYVF
jgi:hypothetical protein